MVVFKQDASLDAKKRRKRERAKAKVRKNKNASAATTATTATVEAVAAKDSIPSEDGTKEERTSTSESARDRVARMSAAGEKSINGSVGEAIARQGIATAVARVTASPLPNGTAVGAGARSAPVGDEDGFVTTKKLNSRRSATAQNWRAGSWGAGSFNLHGGRGVERAGCRRGSSVAPEEVLPEAAPAPLEPTEKASAGGVGNNAGEFSGGQEVLSAGEKLLMGAGGAAAPTPLEPTEEGSAGGVVNNAGEFSGGQEVLGAGEKLLMGAGGAAAPLREKEGRERSAAAPEEGGGGAAVAAVVAAAGAAGTKAKGRKGHAQGHRGSQEQGGSPPGGGGRGRRRRRRKGGRGENRAKSGAMTGVEVASTTKNGFPSPSGPLPRGLANASGQNHCFLNVVVQCLWHLDAFREKVDGSSNSNSNSSTAVGAWGKKPRVRSKPCFSR